MMHRRWSIAATAAAFASLLAGCGTAAGGASRPRAPRAEPPLVIVDADQAGAIVLDGRRRVYRGVRRDGTLAWHAPVDARAAVPMACVAACPDAILSGSAASMNSLTTPDPEPVLVLGGARTPLPGLPGPKRDVLAATGVDDVVLAAGDRSGRAWLEVRRGARTERVSVGGARTSWQQSADRSHALAISLAPEGNQARWFDRRDGSWRPTGVPGAVKGASACVHPDGQRALLIGQRPAVLDRTGRQRPITDLEQAGTCAWAAAGGIVADLSWGTSGPHADVRVFDAAGTVTLSRAIPAEAMVTADPTAPRVAYAALGVVHEFDARSGAELRATRGVRAARYDGAGGLVVARNGGGVAWMAGASVP